MSVNTRADLFMEVSKSGLMGSIANGTWDGALITPGSDAFGWWNYENTLPQQFVEPGDWVTIMNSGAGPNTDTTFRPKGMGDLLVPETGQIRFDELNVGDEIYIRHIINLIPQVRSCTVSFGHRFGHDDVTRTPTGMKMLLDVGGGIATDFFLLDAHFYIKNEDERDYGMYPQVLVSNNTFLEYKGCYISVTKR